MNRKLLILVLIFIDVISICYSQNLLTVGWQKVICIDGYIDGVYSIFNDNNGNTYTLGSFPNAANCLGDNVIESKGSYFLIKQDSSGDKVFAKNFGGTDNFTFGDIKVCSNGDLVLGVCFKSNFFLNGDSITTSVDWSSIILKLDQNFNLKWFKTFPAKNANYINQLLLDSSENIYTSILFIDSLSINGSYYSQEGGYGTAIAKLNSAGNILWAHHYFSNNGLANQVLKLGKNCDSCSNTLLISGGTGGDSIFVDGILQAQHKTKLNDQFFISSLDENGNILQTKFLYEGIRSITDINFYQNRIFLAGSYLVNWNGTYMTPLDYTSIYIGELNEQADLIGLASIQSSKKFYLTGFDITPKYGYVLSGCFDGSFSIQSSSLIAEQYDRGSFIASLNDSLKLNDCKYIKGGSYGLEFLSIFNNKIIGAGVFEQTCNFQNQSCFAWNDDISIFQTTDISELTAFNPHELSAPIIPVPLPELPIPFKVNIYPNPSNNQFIIDANTNDKLSVYLYDVNGRSVLETIIQFSPKPSMNSVDVSYLSEGVYNLVIKTEGYVINKKLVIIH